MTVHSSKGLEFECVFVAGMEETLFPHINSLGDGDEEEERRLAYVAITRAKKYLYLTCAVQRNLFGKTAANPISRFIREIPDYLKDNLGLGSSGYSGIGWEKRGSRHGISGSGVEAGRGGVYGYSYEGDYPNVGLSSPRSQNRPVSHKPAVQVDRSVIYATGDRINHKTFGAGSIVEVSGDILTVFFDSGTQRKLLKDFAPIVKIDK